MKSITIYYKPNEDPTRMLAVYRLEHPEDNDKVVYVKPENWRGKEEGD